MLFDWKKATPVVSLEGIIAWLETKNPDQQYDFSNCQGLCLFSQYLTDRVGVPAIRPNELGRSVFDVWIKLHDSYRDIACTAPWTFRGALKRAREMRVQELA